MECHHCHLPLGRATALSRFTLRAKRGRVGPVVDDDDASYSNYFAFGRKETAL